MRNKTMVSLLLVFALLLGSAGAVTPIPEGGMRGVWVSTVYNIDYPSAAGLSAEQLRAEADEILDKVKSAGLNAVFLQVRPSADALYPSKYYPWSRYLTGAAGRAPEGGFDPLAYWVGAAHQRGLELHAWLNPYRITKEGKGELDALPEDSPAKQHPEWVVEYEGNYYFNPGLPAVRDYVVQGALEIVQHYQVDGIHLDDYFYPGTDFNDAETFARYGKGELADWRRDNVNLLVEALDKALHKQNPKLSFGISPAGIWDNKADNPKGSETRGRSSYRAIYCDSLYWIEHGLVDYICPQLYWSIGYEVADFSVLLDWWQKAVSTSDVALYIGIGAYRAAEAEAGDTWYGTAELARQLALLDKAADVQGAVFFSYRSLGQVDGLPALLQEHYAEKDSEKDLVPENKTERAPAGLFAILSRFLTSLLY